MASTGLRAGSDRFLPPDPRVEEPHRLTPQLALRVGLLGALALFVFAVLFLRLWALQILSGNEYLRAAQTNQLRTVRIEAKRGPILDRKGRPLVTNAPSTAVLVWPADLPLERRYHELRRLAKVLDVPLAPIVADMKKRRGDPLTPVVVKTDVDKRHVYYLEEHGEDFPGVQVAYTYVRRYDQGMLAAHVVGHVGEISPEQLKKKRRQNYRAGDKIGQGGLEWAFDRYLRGRPGLAQLRVDSLGRPRSDLVPRQIPTDGNGIQLTLDIDVQRAAERALKTWIERARSTPDCVGCWAAKGGAIVAMDARDGAIRALASAPRYNPSLYAGRVDQGALDRAGLTVARAEALNRPGLNRAIAGLYPAGSTFKPVTALAAMQEHLISPYEPLQCDPVFESYDQKFKNWNSSTNMPMALATALEQSCDTYFYRLGEAFYRLPDDRGQPLQSWASQFGFGKRSGIEIPGESSGLLPTIRWRKATYDTKLDRLWKPGDSIQLAIGQKDLQVTPLQMTRFYAFLANRGRLVTPHLVTAVVRPGTNRSDPVPIRRLPAPPVKPVNVDPTGLEVVRQGLYQATHGTFGTSTAVFGSFPIAIAGKTGTAEMAVPVPGLPPGTLVDQSWWCGYGPVESPELVVCALIENGGHGGTAAAPAALEVFAEYFDVPAEYQLPTSTD